MCMAAKKEGHQILGAFLVRCNQHVFCVTRSLDTNEDVVEEISLQGALHGAAHDL